MYTEQHFKQMNTKLPFYKSINLHEYFKKNRELIFGYSSVIGLLVSIVSMGYAIYASDCNKSFAFIAITISLANICSTFLCIYLTRRYDSATEQLRKSADIISSHEEKYAFLKSQANDAYLNQGRITAVTHNIAHGYRTLLNQIHTDLVLGKFDEINDREKSFIGYIDLFVNNIKDIFNALTGDTCSVCIKFLEEDKESKTIFVRTYRRDSLCYRERCPVDQEIERYPYYRNTAFISILSPTGKSYFLCNNLSERASKGEYENFNPMWHYYYNACLVVPIRASVKSGYFNNQNIGFLCVDNMKGGFDQVIGFNLLAAFADLSFVLFRSLFNLREQALVRAT